MDSISKLNDEELLGSRMKTFEGIHQKYIRRADTDLLIRSAILRQGPSWRAFLCTIHFYHNILATHFYGVQHHNYGIQHVSFCFHW
jgi:hypothetical protein